GVEEGGSQARQGRSGADGIVDDARRGVAAIAPATGTRAGKTEMVEHLQERLLAMRGRLIQSEQNAMRIAQQIRGAGAGYRGAGMGGGAPMMGG
ncbi:peptidoglycan endopeptidase, partial [Mycobacteroides abscessus subsp. abscessus]